MMATLISVFGALERVGKLHAVERDPRRVDPSLSPRRTSLVLRGAPGAYMYSQEPRSVDSGEAQPHLLEGVLSIKSPL